MLKCQSVTMNGKYFSQPNRRWGLFLSMRLAQSVTLHVRFDPPLTTS